MHTETTNNSENKPEKLGEDFIRAFRIYSLYYVSDKPLLYMIREKGRNPVAFSLSDLLDTSDDYSIPYPRLQLEKKYNLAVFNGISLRTSDNVSIAIDFEDKCIYESSDKFTVELSRFGFDEYVASEDFGYFKDVTLLNIIPNRLDREEIDKMFEKLLKTAFQMPEIYGIPPWISLLAAYGSLVYALENNLVIISARDKASHIYDEIKALYYKRSRAGRQNNLPQYLFIDISSDIHGVFSIPSPDNVIAEHYMLFYKPRSPVPDIVWKLLRELFVDRLPVIHGIYV